jgi:hypothetical protein
MSAKKCRLCGVDKEEVEFRLVGKYRRTECHTCELEAKRKRDSLPKQLEKHAQYEKLRRQREDVKEKNRAYFQGLRQSPAFKEKARKDPRRKESQKKWRSKACSKILRRDYYRFKRATDVRYRVSNGFSRAVRRGLKNGKLGVSWKTMVSYSVEQLMAHLEAKFQLGMTWGNYGKDWHIDHIIPVSSFSFEKPQDDGFKKCWSLDNLQPLWAKDNLQKGSKVSGL